MFDLRGALCVAGVAAVALVSGCAGGSATMASTSGAGSPAGSGPAASRPHTVSGVVLLPATASERAACRRLARTKSIPVLCPTVLPRPDTTYPATPIGVHTFPFCQALRRPARCPLYDFAVLYGAPDESPGGEPHNAPASFLHFEVLGGRYVGDALGLQGRAGTVPLQRRLGRRTLAGHRGQLYFGLPYTRGGGEFGSHYTFVWQQGRWKYAASLHSWTPRTATLGVLTALVAGLSVQRP